jgi:hypothetical protein
MRRAQSSPAAVAAVVLLLFAGWAGWARQLGHDWRDWADVGREFAQRNAASATIRADARFSATPLGYDGQFFLYLSLIHL